MHKIPFSTWSITLLVAGLLLASCAGEQGNNSDGESNQKPNTFIDLYMRYMEDEKQAKVTANFYNMDEVGKRTPYTEDLKMWFQGRAMDKIPGNSRPGSYQIEVEGVQPDIFEYLLEVAKNKTQKIELDQQNKVAPEVTELSLTTGVKINFASAPLREKETLIIIATDASNKSGSITVNGPFGGIAILPTTNIEGLKPGKVDLYMVRKTRSENKFGTFLAEIDLEYYLSKISATLTP